MFRVQFASDSQPGLLPQARLTLVFVLLIAGASAWSPARAGWRDVLAATRTAAPATQDDSNAQYLTIVEDELAGEPREIPLMVESGSLRLEVILEAVDGVQLTLRNPSGLAVRLDEPNVLVNSVTGRRSVLVWDPRPGAWAVRLEGRGSYRLRVISQGDLFVCCAQILTLNQVFALERSRLVAGSDQQVQIFASGYTIDSLDVQMVDQRAEPIGPVKFRQNDPSNLSGFTLLLAIPGRPFRLMVVGKDLSGKPFRRILPPLLKPVDGPPRELGVNEAEQQAPNPRAIEDLRRTATAGPRLVTRTRIVSWSDEPLLTGAGNQIGIRLRFRAVFPTDANYTPFPSLYPDRIGQGYTGALNLRVHRSSVSPQPAEVNASAWTLDTRAKFSAGVEYRFVVDLVPGYALTMGEGGKFCLNYRPYAQPELINRFENEISSQRRTRFRLSVSGSDLEGRMTSLTEQTYIPDTWLRGLRQEGAGECRF